MPATATPPPTRPRVRPAFPIALVVVAGCAWWLVPRNSLRVEMARLNPGPPVTIQTPTGPITLPAPFATRSAGNNPRLSRPPAGTVLHGPPGMSVTPFLNGAGSIRKLAISPDGVVFAADHRGMIARLADDDHDGHVDHPSVFASGLNQPFGLAFHPDGWLYVGETDKVRRFRYAPGQRVASAGPELVAGLPGNGYNQHWTRDVVFSADHRTLFVSVGSGTNVSPESDPRRAAVSAYDLDGGHARIFASGLRNPVGLAIHPHSHALFAVVNERDELGDDLVPDYLTEVRDGAFYGWPYSYFGRIEDPRRHGERPDLVARATVPDLSLGAHVASLDVLFYTGNAIPGLAGDALVSLHGSWNRTHRVGFKVVRVHFENDRPTAHVEDFVTGWMLPDERVWGRPVGLAQAPDGAVLIVDDGSQTIWRVGPPIVPAAHPATDAGPIATPDASTVPDGAR